MNDAQLESWIFSSLVESLGKSWETSRDTHDMQAHGALRPNLCLSMLKSYTVTVPGRSFEVQSGFKHAKVFCVHYVEHYKRTLVESCGILWEPRLDLENQRGSWWNGACKLQTISGFCRSDAFRKNAKGWLEMVGDLVQSCSNNFSSVDTLDWSWVLRGLVLFTNWFCESCKLCYKCHASRSSVLPIAKVRWDINFPLVSFFHQLERLKTSKKVVARAC